jgi:hypothetical protein
MCSQQSVDLEGAVWFNPKGQAADEEAHAMKLHALTHIVREVNSALDTGKYDDLPLLEVSHQIDAGGVVSWLKHRVPDLDLSVLSAEDLNEYEEGLADIQDAYVGNERRKWGVEKRGLCLLIAWTNELIQRRGWQAD